MTVRLYQLFKGSGILRTFRREVAYLLLSSVVLSMVEFLFIVLFPLLLSLQLTNSGTAMGPKKSLAFFQSLGLAPGIPLISATLGLLVIRTYGVSWIKYFQNKLIAKSKSRLETALFLGSLTGDTIDYPPVERAHLLNLITKETEILAYEFAVPLFSGLGEAAIVAFATGGLFLISPSVGIFCAFLGLMVMAVFFQVNKMIIGSLAKKAFQGRARAHYLANQSLSSIAEIRLYGLEDKISQEFFDATSISANSLSLGKSVGMVWPVVLEGCVYLILYFALTQDSLMHQMGDSTVLGWFGFGAFRVMPSLNRLLVAFAAIRIAFPSVAAVDRALNQPGTQDRFPRLNSLGPEISNQSRSTSPKTGSAPKEEEEDPFAHEGLPLLVGTRGLCFKYPNQRQSIVENLDFSIPAGAVVGLVGTSGTGKSTFARLLLGLIPPDRGAIEFRSGESRVANPNDFVAMVSEKSLVLGETIRDNVILSSKKTPCDDRVIQALFDGGFPVDLDSPKECAELLQREIATLSSGQFQRVMIARALYSGRKFLVLDEATAMLDNETQSFVSETIARLKGKYTILVIAHRKEALAPCDSVYQLQLGGQVVQVM